MESPVRSAAVIAVALLTGFGASAAPPPWAVRDTQRLEGRTYRVVCSGLGPSISLARQDAIDGCKSSAAQQLSADVLIRSTSVVSEREGIYQQEVSHHSRFTGLVCVPKKEQIQETESRVRIWVLCEFDLSRARARRELSAWASEPADPATKTSPGRNTVLTLAVIPRCTDILVKGGGPARRIRCDRNPISVLLHPFDRELVVRSSGKAPKSIPLKENRGAREYDKVVLD